MRLKFVQKTIDKIRGKNKKIKKVLNYSSFPMTEFKIRLDLFIKQHLPYIYPDNKNSVVINYDAPVQIITDKTLLNKIYDESISKLEQFDIKGLDWTYNNLSDNFSKEIMFMHIAYMIFDDVKFRFPIAYSNDFLNIEKFRDTLNNKTADYYKIEKYDLSKIGYDISIYDDMYGLVIDFVHEQYRYGNKVVARQGDYVMDAGACLGDTALYFATKVGDAGKVFSFEFVKENLEIFNKNIGINPKYNSIIQLVENPLGEIPGEKVSFKSQGAGSYIKEKDDNSTDEFEIESIDNYMTKNNIDKMDFIKMDIEGSELSTLKGAKETIKKFRPNLAICVYHKVDDLWTIPQYIKELVPEYKLYLNHHGANGWETVLYATVD